MHQKTISGNLTLNVNFNLRQTTPANETTPINAVVRFNNKRVVISGIDKIEPRFWNFEKQSPRQHAANPRAKQIQKSLSNAEAIIFEHFENVTRMGGYPNDIREFQIECRRRIFNLSETKISKSISKSDDLLQYLEGFRNGIKNGTRIITNGRRKGQSYANNTHKQYGVLLYKISSYIQYKRIGKLSFSDIDLDFYKDFREFVVVHSGMMPSSFGTMIKCLKTVMNDAAEFGYHTSVKHKSRHFVKETNIADNIFLDTDKLDKLFELDLSQHIKFDKVRDLFLIGAYSGLRFSDFSSLRPEDIGEDYIRVKTIKTGQRVTIPITKNLRLIFDKYNRQIPATISNQKFNEHLKELGKHAGFNDNVDITKFIKGKEYSVSVPFYQLMTSHTARRSFATNMFKAGIPSILIMAITGHSTEKSFLTYIKLNNDDKATLMMDILRRSEMKVVNDEKL